MDIVTDFIFDNYTQMIQLYFFVVVIGGLLTIFSQLKAIGIINAGVTVFFGFAFVFGQPAFSSFLQENNNGLIYQPNLSTHKIDIFNQNTYEKNGEYLCKSKLSLCIKESKNIKATK